MDIITLVMKVLNLNFGEAVNYLGDYADLPRIGEEWNDDEDDDSCHADEAGIATGSNRYRVDW